MAKYNKITARYSHNKFSNNDAEIHVSITKYPDPNRKRIIIILFDVFVEVSPPMYSSFIIRSSPTKNKTTKTENYHSGIPIGYHF